MMTMNEKMVSDEMLENVAGGKGMETKRVCIILNTTEKSELTEAELKALFKKYGVQFFPREYGDNLYFINGKSVDESTVVGHVKSRLCH